MRPRERSSAVLFFSPGIQSGLILQLSLSFCSSQHARKLFPVTFEERPLANQRNDTVLSVYSLVILCCSSCPKQKMEISAASSSFCAIRGASNICSSCHEKRKKDGPWHPPIPNSDEASTKMWCNDGCNRPSTKSKETPLLASNILAYSLRLTFTDSRIMMTPLSSAEAIAFVRCAKKGLPKGATSAA